MSLSGLLTAVVEYVGDVIVNDCGRPTPDHVLRYHGSMPHYCCTANGVLSVNWTLENAVGGFPTTPRTNPCEGFPVASIDIKYVVCWPGLQIDPVSGLVMADEEWDELAAMFADVADCVTRALLRLRCPPVAADEFTQAVITESGGRVHFIDCTPIQPGGLCAGVRWRMYAAVRTPQDAS